MILTPNWSEKDIENALHLTLNQPHVAFASGSWRILRRDVGGIVFEARYSYSKKKQKSVLRHFHPIAGEEVIIYRKEIIEKGITSLRWLLHDFKP